MEVAKKLLRDVLKTEESPDVKDEVERRLDLLESEPVSRKKCVSCGKIFLGDPRKRFKQKFCQECVKKYAIHK